MIETKSLCEGCGTYHASNGKFCPKKDACSMSKDGERYKVIKQYKRVTRGTAGDVQLHGRRRKRSRQAEAMRRSNLGKMKMAVSGELSAPGFVTMGSVLGENENGMEVEMDDTKLIAAAKAVVKADPKSRFSPTSVRRHIAKELGIEYVKLVAKGGGRYSEMREVDRLASGKMADRAFKSDRARGFYRILKKAKGKGLEFRRLGAEETDILYNGTRVGEIVRQAGLKPGATRETVFTYDVDIEQDEVVNLGGEKPSIGKGHFSGLNAAKKWAKAELKRVGL